MIPYLLFPTRLEPTFSALLLALGFGAIFLLVAYSFPISPLRRGFRNAEVTVIRKHFFLRIPAKDYIYVGAKDLRILQLDGRRLRLRGKGMRWAGFDLQVEFLDPDETTSIVNDLREAGSTILPG